MLVLGLLVPGTALGADAAAGAKVSAEKCAGCHGSGGAGDGVLLSSLGVTTPPVSWTDKAKMAAFSDQDLNNIITNGGKAEGKPPIMPPFGQQLSGDQIANLMAYIRSLAQ
jgi:mono/diheme cytochrome c family protein